MAKLKTHSGAKKRLKRTGSGKLAYRRNGRQHLLLQKSKRQKRIPRKQLLDPTNARALELLVPYM